MSKSNQNSPEFPSFRLFAGGYLNLDWNDDYATPEDALKDFIAREQIAAELRCEVLTLLSTHQSEEELHERIVDEFGLGYLPSGDGHTWAEWLNAVAQNL